MPVIKYIHLGAKMLCFLNGILKTKNVLSQTGVSVSTDSTEPKMGPACYPDPNLLAELAHPGGAKRSLWFCTRAPHSCVRLCAGPC